MSQQSDPYDVIIIGGGPAGSAAGMTLARKGLHAVILEKSHHPRFHIGESLLPRNYTLLQEYGLADKMRDVPHVPKYGAEFGMGGGTETSLFHFDNGFTPNQQTFNVERALFDKMLLDSAREDGVEVREDVAVKKILKLADGDVRVLLDTGEELSAKWLFDASGQSTVVARHLGTRKPPSERHLQKVAYFSHFEGVFRHPGREEGHPLIVMCDEGWFWVIPINDTVTSIGLVMDAEIARSTGVPADRMLHWGMQRCPLVRARCQDATGPTTNQTIANFSYKCDPFAGPGYFLIGDSAAFVDPIFSTGVCLAMMEGRRAAEHVKAMLNGLLTPAAARKDYIRFAKRSTSIYFDIRRSASPATGSSPACSRGHTYALTASRRSSLATRPSAESTPAAPGTSTVSIPSSSASAHACNGPAPPKATSAKPAGSCPRSTETTRSARSISALTISMTSAGSSSSSALSAADLSSSRPPASVGGSRSRRRFASVTVGCVPPRP